MELSKKIDRTPSYDDMEGLFVNNDKLVQIESYLNRFNPIKIMKMERMEIRHSAILAWLLDPKETHGLGDRFIKIFLSEALRDCSDLGYPTALDILQSDFRDAEVRCEWKNIDIFIFSPNNKWAFIIENKFNSKQREGQLSTYMGKVTSHYQEQGTNLKVRGVFLTLHDEEAQDTSYAPIKYETICEFLPRLIEQEAHHISSEVKTFLTHYIDILKEATGMSEERDDMEKLARQLYRDHKKVLDFVMENGASSDFMIAARSLFGDDPEYLDDIRIGKNDYQFSGMNNRIVSFLPTCWYEALGEDEFDWEGCENWWAGYPVVSWFQIINTDSTKGELRLYAEVGPIKDHDFRSSLIQSIQSVASEIKSSKIKFQRSADSEGKKYSKFLKENIIEIKDIQDADELSTAMKKLLKKFQPEFKAIAKVLPQYLKHGAKGKS